RTYNNIEKDYIVVIHHILEHTHIHDRFIQPDLHEREQRDADCACDICYHQFGTHESCITLADGTESVNSTAESDCGEDDGWDIDLRFRHFRYIHEKDEGEYDREH